MGSLAPGAFPAVPLDPEVPDWGRQVAEATNNILIGKLNNTGTAVLPNGVASITVSDARCGPNTVIVPMASGSVPLGHWSIQTRTNGAFTITRVSTTGNCSIAYTLLG